MNMILPSLAWKHKLPSAACSMKAFDFFRFILNDYLNNMKGRFQEIAFTNVTANSIKELVSDGIPTQFTALDNSC